MQSATSATSSTNATSATSATIATNLVQLIAINTIQNTTQTKNQDVSLRVFTLHTSFQMSCLVNLYDNVFDCHDDSDREINLMYLEA